MASPGQSESQTRKSASNNFDEPSVMSLKLPTLLLKIVSLENLDLLFATAMKQGFLYFLLIIAVLYAGIYCQEELSGDPVGIAEGTLDALVPAVAKRNSHLRETFFYRTVIYYLCTYDNYSII